MVRKFVDLSKTPEGENHSNGDEVDNKGHDEEINIHHVPFKVEYEGKANVGLKFTSKSRPLPTDSKVLINQFRGRPLQGQKIDLPKDYEGLIASDLKKSSNDDESDCSSKETEISIVKRFDSMTYWNWDRVPSGMDKHVKLTDWVELAQILHDPIQD